jgi:hypothetical protein
MNETAFKKYLQKVNACQEGVKFAEGKTLQQAWDACTRPDWMLWLYRKNNPDKIVCVRIAIFSARQSLKFFTKKYPKDNQPLKAIEAAEAWAENPTEENRKAAYAAYAAAAADAADADAYADAYAAAAAYAYADAYAAAYAAYAAYAADAAYAAAYAADAAAYAAYAAYAAAKSKMRIKICNYIRELIPTLEIKDE